MLKSRSKPVAITLGDPAGIGPEVAAKAIQSSAIRKLKNLLIIGEFNHFQRHCPQLPSNCTFLDLKNLPKSGWRIGKPSRICAQASLDYLESACALIQRGQARALVTAPVCKEAINLLDRHFHGHTEYLAEAFHVKKFGMMFVGGGIKTILVTRHLPIKAVSSALSTQNILETIRLAQGALKSFFKIARPSIGVTGLNPHAGEGGTLGREEITTIIPAIQKAQRLGIRVQGPLSGDTAFTPHVAKQFDALVTMYHDQGLIAVKAKDWDRLVNLTVGLPFIRTSPAHGTAFNIAGQNRANPQSMIAAIELADRLSRS